jgi:hypothetical protein
MSYVIPKQLYIGYQERLDCNYRLPVEERIKVKLGFATYHEDNAKFENRKSTIDSWAQPYDIEYIERPPNDTYKHGWNEKIQHPRDDLKSELLDNEPLTGFKLSDFVKRTGWNGGNVVWRIQDPRGFELEISSANMQQLIDYCVINKGVIESPCVYAWTMKGSKVCLIPTNCDLYQEAELDTVRRGLPVIKISQINIGDVVAFRNSKVAVFWGNMYYYNEAADSLGTFCLRAFKSNLFQIIEINSDNTITTVKWEWMKDPKIVEIKGALPETIPSNIDAINQLLAKQVFEKVPFNNHISCVDFVSDQQIKLSDPIVSLQPISVDKTGYSNVFAKNLETGEIQFVHVEHVVWQGKEVQIIPLECNSRITDLDSVQYLNQITVPSRYHNYSKMTKITDTSKWEFYVPCVSVNNVKVPVTNICAVS